MQRWMRRWFTKNQSLKETLAWETTSMNVICLERPTTYAYRGTCVLGTTTSHGSVLEVTLDDVLVHLAIITSFATSIDFESTLEVRKPGAILRFQIQKMGASDVYTPLEWHIQFKCID